MHIIEGKAEPVIISYHANIITIQPNPRIKYTHLQIQKSQFFYQSMQNILSTLPRHYGRLYNQIF